MKPTPRTDRRIAGVFLLAVGLLTMAGTPCNLRIPELPGSSEKEGRQGTMDVFAVDHELVQPIDPTSGAANGIRTHRALTILKGIDRASPGLHKSVGAGRTFRSAALEFYRIDPATRTERVYYLITLKTVRIVGVKTLVPTTFLPENEAYGHMEEVRIVYDEIEWTWLPDNISESDTWRPRELGQWTPSAALEGTGESGVLPPLHAALPAFPPPPSRPPAERPRDAPRTTASSASKEGRAQAGPGRPDPGR